MNAEEITQFRLLAPHSSGPSDDKMGHSAIRTNAHGHIFTDFCEVCLVCENAYGMHADKRMCVRACVFGCVHRQLSTDVRTFLFGPENTCEKRFETYLRFSQISFGLKNLYDMYTKVDVHLRGQENSLKRCSERHAPARNLRLAMGRMAHRANRPSIKCRLFKQHKSQTQPRAPRVEFRPQILYGMHTDKRAQYILS